MIRREASTRIFVVQEETDKTAGNIQARSFTTRTLEKLGRNAKLKERQKWSHEKPNEEFISLTLRTRNSKRPLRMLARNWKHCWLLLCLARQARNVSMGRPVTRPRRSNQNLRVFWKPVNANDCVWENLYRIIMWTIWQERETIHCSIMI